VEVETEVVASPDPVPPERARASEPTADGDPPQLILVGSARRDPSVPGSRHDARCDRGTDHAFGDTPRTQRPHTSDVTEASEFGEELRHPDIVLRYSMRLVLCGDPVDARSRHPRTEGRVSLPGCRK
jgi:hypothetical protein